MNPPPCTDWREISYNEADPRAPWSCQITHESVQRVALWGENADFWPLSKFNTGSLLLRGKSHQ